MPDGMRCNCPLTLIYPERARCLQGDGSPRPMPHVHCLPSNTTQREKDRNGNVEMLTLLSLSSRSHISLSHHWWEMADSTSHAFPSPFFYSFSHTLPSLFLSHFTPSLFLSIHFLGSFSSPTLISLSPDLWHDTLRASPIPLTLCCRRPCESWLFCSLYLGLPWQKRFHAILLAFSRESHQLVFVVCIYQSCLLTFRWEMIKWQFSEGKYKSTSPVVGS